MVFAPVVINSDNTPPGYLAHYRLAQHGTHKIPPPDNALKFGVFDAS